MSKKTISWLLIISLLINISAIFTFSYYRWFHPQKTDRSYRGKHKSYLQKKLDCTKEQMEEMSKLRDKLFEEMKPYRDQLHQQRETLIEVLKQDSVSNEKIEEMVDSLTQTEKRIHKLAISNLIKYRSILNPEQREKFLKIMTMRIFGPDSRKMHFKKHNGEKAEQREEKADSTKSSSTKLN